MSGLLSGSMLLDWESVCGMSGKSSLSGWRLVWGLGGWLSAGTGVPGEYSNSSFRLLSFESCGLDLINSIHVPAQSWVLTLALIRAILSMRLNNLGWSMPAASLSPVGFGLSSPVHDKLPYFKGSSSWAWSPEKCSPNGLTVVRNQEGFLSKVTDFQLFSKPFAFEIIANCQIVSTGGFVRHQRSRNLCWFSQDNLFRTEAPRSHHGILGLKTWK